MTRPTGKKVVPTFTNEYVGQSPVLSGSPLETAMHRDMQKAALSEGSAFGQQIRYWPKDGSPPRVIVGSWHPVPGIPVNDDPYDAEQYGGTLHVDYDVITNPVAGDRYEIDGDMFTALQPGHPRQGTLQIDLHRLGYVRGHASPIREGSA